MKITANGISVNYTLDGPAGAPVVMLSHSLATDLSMWDPQMKALTAHYRVLRYDSAATAGPTRRRRRTRWTSSRTTRGRCCKRWASPRSTGSGCRWAA